MKFLEDEDSEEHLALQKRLKKTFYCGKMKTIDCQSLAMTELAVEYLQELVPRELGRIDMFWASSLSRDVTVTPCALMLALIYLKRLKASNSQYLNQVSSSDLFLISVLVASKYLYDEGESPEVSNVQWARETKTDIEDINEGERTFLSAMDWKIFVKPEEFWSFLQDMEEKVAWKMSLRRDNFTYTDLFVIISSGSTQQILFDALLELCKMAVVFMTAYVGCVLTLCASNVIPAVIFSHALFPIASSSSRQADISAFVHDLPSPARSFRTPRCVPAVRHVPRRSLHRLMNARLSFNAISDPEIPRVCQPRSPSWSPSVCFHASACITIALIEELAVHGYGALLNLKSSMSAGFGRNFKVNPIGGRSYDADSPGRLRGFCSGRGVDSSRPNISLSSFSASGNSSVCAQRPSGVRQKSAEAIVAKRNQQNFVERSVPRLGWNTSPFVHHMSADHNHSQSYRSVSSLTHLVQVFG